MDWPGDAETRRLVKIQLRKKAPQGVHVFWKHVLPSDPEIDVRSISSRKPKNEEWQKAWNEAHDALRERAKRPKTQIPISPDEMDAE